MIVSSKNMLVRRSLCVCLVIGFVMAGSTVVFADAGNNGEDADVGVADIYDGDASDFDSGDDDSGDVEDDSGVEMDVEDDSGVADDTDVEDDFDGDVEQDVSVDEDVDGDSDVEAGDIGDQGDEDAGVEFLFVDVGVEVQFSGDAPSVVTLGLSGDLGEVEPAEVSVSGQGVATWDVEDVQAGAWILSATADGYEPVRYRFVAGELSQMLIRISMVEVGSHADAKVESGWACSAVGSDAAPTMLVSLGLVLGSMWIRRRRNR